MDLVLAADKSENVEIQKKTMDWTRDLTELFSRRAKTKGVHSSIQGLRTKYNGEFDASEFFKELDQIKPANAHWTFTLPAAVIGISLAIFLIGMFIWRKCTNKDEIPTPTPLAPPMLAQNLNTRPIANLVTTNQATKSNASITIKINIS
jgi:hypothetical protein